MFREAREIAQLVKMIALQTDLCLCPQHPYKRPGLVVCTREYGGEEDTGTSLDFAGQSVLLHQQVQWQSCLKVGGEGGGHLTSPSGFHMPFLHDRCTYHVHTHAADTCT